MIPNHRRKSDFSRTRSVFVYRISECSRRKNDFSVRSVNDLLPEILSVDLFCSLYCRAGTMVVVGLRIDSLLQKSSQICCC